MCLGDKQCNNEVGQVSSRSCAQMSNKRTTIEDGYIYKCKMCNVSANGPARFNGHLLSHKHIENLMLNHWKCERFYCKFDKRFFS